jgi:hypothetical protein
VNPPSGPEPTALERLEEARRLVTDAAQLLEDSQRVLFRAGDRYVAEVWGDGVRAVIEITERITTIAGDLTRIPIEIDRVAARDRKREP